MNGIRLGILSRGPPPQSHTPQDRETRPPYHRSHVMLASGGIMSGHLNTTVVHGLYYLGNTVSPPSLFTLFLAPRLPRPARPALPPFAGRKGTSSTTL